jgi:uncharacterized protein DUF4386
MSTDVMKEWISAGSPRLNARIAGLLYLIVIVAAPFAQVFVRGKLVVYRDAAATTTNILALEFLYRLAGAADLIAFTCDAAVALILYQLLKPVSKSLALFAAVFRLLHVAVVAPNALNHFAPLVILGGAHFFAAFKPDQLQALALMSLGCTVSATTSAWCFFCLHCLFVGFLIARSAFLPRIFGPLLVIAGLCHLINTFANSLSPSFAAHLFPYILLPGLSEVLLALWLIVIGVNVKRWNEQASAAQEVL